MESVLLAIFSKKPLTPIFCAKMCQNITRFRLVGHNSMAHNGLAKSSYLYLNYQILRVSYPTLVANCTKEEGNNGEFQMGERASPHFPVNLWYFFNQWHFARDIAESTNIP